MPSLYSINSLKCNFGSIGGPTFSRGGGRTQLLIPYRTCDFQGESGPPVTPNSFPGSCMTDPSQNDRVFCVYCTDFPIAKITYSNAKCMLFFRNVTQLETVLKEKSHWAFAMM